MTIDQLKGLPVISVADGERLGTVTRAYFDGEAKRIVGFAFEASGGLFSAEWAPQVDVGHVQSLGRDALTLADRNAVKGEETERRYGELIDSETLSNRQLMTEGGRSLGKVSSIEFDERTFGLQRIEASKGVFNKDQTQVLADEIVAIGADYVIVAEEMTARVTSTSKYVAEPKRIVEQ